MLYVKLQHELKATRTT